ncbi:MAG: RNA polymerase sigma factor [Acidimicrobiia bacterium]|nr:RNA polymerase sigma factor [Acidimicrobiia bacterium]
MSPTEGVLKKRLAADLDEAFPTMLEEMQGLVFNGARRWLPSQQDAEDVTQEVFVRAYRALADYRPERIAELRLKPWLFTITINLCRNHARTRGRRPSQVPLDGYHDPAGPGSVESDAVTAVAIDEWRDRLARLPTPQRDAIVLRHVIGLSYAEVGEVLDRPAGTVKSDVSRGLTRLRTMLATEETT